MNKWTWLLMGVIASSHALAFGKVGQWVSGWGQGESEFIVLDAQRNALLLSCGEASDGYMQLTLGGIEYGSYGRAGGFSLIVDGKRYPNPHATDTLAGRRSFHAAWEAMRTARTLQARTDRGQVVTLPLRGAAKVLLSHRDQDFPCQRNYQY